MKKTTLIICLLVTGINAFSQSGYTLGKLSNISQNGFYFNPADGTDQNFMIGMPMMNRIDVGIMHSGLTYNETVADGTLNVGVVIPKMSESAEGMGNVNIDLLSGGFHFGDIWIRAGISEHVSFLFEYDRDLLDLAWYGNGSDKTLGKRVDMSNTAAFGLVHREYKVGGSMKLPFFENLRVGMNIKAIQGLAAVQTSSFKLGLQTDPETYALSADAQFQVNTAGIDSVGGSNYQDYYFKNQNWGMGTDLGISYANNKFTAELSAMNMGAIWWKEQIKNYNLESVQHQYAGVSLNELIEDNNADPTELMTNVLDSIMESFEPEETTTAFKTKLNTSFMFSGSYAIMTDGELYATVIHNRIFDHGLNQFIFGYRQDVGQWFSVTGNASITDNGIKGIGMAAMFKFNPIQFYVSTDNILGAIDPYSYQSAHVNLGINFVFGTRDQQ